MKQKKASKSRKRERRVSKSPHNDSIARPKPSGVKNHKKPKNKQRHFASESSHPNSENSSKNRIQNHQSTPQAENRYPETSEIKKSAKNLNSRQRLRSGSRTRQNDGRSYSGMLEKQKVRNQVKKAMKKSKNLKKCSGSVMSPLHEKSDFNNTEDHEESNHGSKDQSRGQKCQKNQKQVNQKIKKNRKSRRSISPHSGVQGPQKGHHKAIPKPDCQSKASNDSISQKTEKIIPVRKAQQISFGYNSKEDQLFNQPIFISNGDQNPTRVSISTQNSKKQKNPKNSQNHQKGQSNSNQGAIKDLEASGDTMHGRSGVLNLQSTVDANSPYLTKNSSSQHLTIGSELADGGILIGCESDYYYDSKKRRSRYQNLPIDPIKLKPSRSAVIINYNNSSSYDHLKSSTMDDNKENGHHIEILSSGLNSKLGGSETPSESSGQEKGAIQTQKRAQNGKKQPKMTKKSGGAYYSKGAQRRAPGGKGGTIGTLKDELKAKDQYILDLEDKLFSMESQLLNEKLSHEKKLVNHQKTRHQEEELTRLHTISQEKRLLLEESTRLFTNFKNLEKKFLELNLGTSNTHSVRDFDAGGSNFYT